MLIVDGGLATGLEARGHRLHSWLWSAGVFLSDPGAVERLHREYVDAGADVILSASYQMSFEGLARAGHDAAATERALRGTVSCARRAATGAAREVQVAASVGPYGAAAADGSEYRGHYGVSPEALRGFHRRRLGVLADAGADLLAAETIPSLDETQVLCELLGDHPAARAWISFCCRDRAHLGDGTEIGAAARLADRCPQVVALGVNCTHPDLVAGLIGGIRRASDKPIVVYPNSGEAWDEETRRWTGASTVDFCRLAETWAELGVAAIGGCCRVGPPEIRELARRFKSEP